MKFDAYVASDFMWATLPRGTCRIQVFHGVGGKYGFDAPDRSMREWHRLFFVNERRLRNFIAAGAIDAGQSGDPARRDAEGRLPRRRQPATRRGARSRSVSIRRFRPCSTRRPGRRPRRSTRWGVDLVRALAAAARST